MSPARGAIVMGKSKSKSKSGNEYGAAGCGNMDPIPFRKIPGHGTSTMCFYRTVDWRRPVIGEFYLKGMVGHKALRNVAGFYWVVRPTYIAEKMLRWTKAERIRL